MQQIIAIIFAATINIGTETTVFGFIVQTCAQFEIFENRLRNLISRKTSVYKNQSSSLNKDKITLSECIRYHLRIYKSVI